ncbi:T9SS type A sorting domain-containing protein [Portibacter lacus]|uniref:Secretion system C-terminal sorting domain-containing protein n=1 Tax=Portibacter lacus TaxID=1099794 RepID=A0AA37SU75_9BACT|nr:T9SS type A sorting domain-containing protein [Portibacter lacus]GLR18200.1 hypothetical protein GCM10007940_28150 [Portibacter lacus]
MNKITFTLLFLSMCFMTFGQEYIEQFDEDIEGQFWLSDGYTSSVADGEWTITGDGTAGAYSIFAYLPGDADGVPTALDVSGNNKIYVRVKASNNGTQLRLDLKDADGYTTSLAGLNKFMVANYTVYEFDFSGKLQDGGYGGTSCTEDTKPCDVDPTKIVEFQFYINADQGGFAGTVILDFISVGSEPQVGPMSDVFQVHFDDPEDRGFIMTEATGYTNTLEDSQWKIKGDGTNGMWDVVSMLTFNPATKDTVDISLADGENKLFVRMKSTVPGTAIRIDVQDINSFATTGGSITQVITDEFETYEFNYAGSYQDLAYGGTGCTEGGPACDVDPERIANMIFFINPGTEAFAGEVSIDYISVGTALEIIDTNDELVYGDHFSATTDYVSSSGTYEIAVENSILSITGSGEDVAYSNIAYSLNDEETGIAINATGNNKVFIKARSTEPNTLLRVDLLDSVGYSTTQPSLTRVLSTDFQVIELNYSNQYTDAGYGGTPCESGPCDVDGTAIKTMYLYPNPADGGFAGTIEIDYISFGKPLGEEVVEFKYADQFEDGDISKITMATGVEITESEGVMTWKGDGTSSAWAAMVYTPHNAETFEDYILDITPTDKIYMKAKSTTPVTVRLDLKDSDGFATTEPATSVSITEEYQIIEFDFAGTYTDGAYGGTSCNEENKPCAVDGTKISSFSFFIEPGTGMFDGEISIDWISTIDPLETDTVDLGPAGIDDFAEEFTTNDLAFLSTREGNALSATDGVLKISGDGTSGAYAPTSYTINDGVDSLIVNAANNDNKVFIRMKASTDTTTLRVDLNDNRGYHTTQAGLEKTLSTEFEVYEYDFTGKYKDGGYGGTTCESGPCNVDPERISHIQLYIDAGEGNYAGDLEIDWISFGEPLTSSVLETEVVKTAKVYPNPAKGEFYLELDAKVAGNMVASFIDISGKTVKVQSLGNATKGSNHKLVRLDQLVEGMYFLKITIANKEAFYQKVFVK